MNLQTQILKNTFNLYNDEKSFANYETIAKKYHKLYSTLTKDKKNDMNNNDIYLWNLINENASSLYKDKLKEEIKKWFMSLSLEQRIKVVTVENEWVCNIIFQMYHFIQDNSSSEFQPKECYFYPDYKQHQSLNVNNQKKVYCVDDDDITKDGLIYPANKPNFSTIKITKEKMNKIETQTTEYKQEIDDLSGESFLELSFKNFFKFKSEKKNDKYLNGIDDHLLSEIRFYSAHHLNGFPDCMTLSPSVVLQEKLLEGYFNQCCSNRNYLTSLIKPYYSQKTKNYSYMLPDWMKCDSYFTIFQIIFAFFEQAIVIKFLLNYQFKKNVKNQPLITSLINEENLDRFFQKRKIAINYINVNYNIETREDLLNKTIDLKELCSEAEKEKEEAKNNKKPLKFIMKTTSEKNGNYPSFVNSIRNTKSNNTLTEVERLIREYYENYGNIEFVDNLIYHNIKSLWEMRMLVKEKLFLKLIDLNAEKECQDLIDEYTTVKKKKKGNQVSSEDLKVNIPKKKEKELEDELYLPYYIKNNYDNGYNLQRKGMSGVVINKVVNEPQIIKNFILKEILEQIISRALSTDNSELDHFVNFFNETKTPDKYKKNDINLLNNLLENDYNQFINNNSNKQIGSFETGLIQSNSSKEKETNKTEETSPQDSNKEITPNDQKETFQEENQTIQSSLQKDVDDIQNEQNDKITNVDQCKNQSQNEFNEELSEITSQEQPNSSSIVNNSSRPKREKKKKEQPFFLYETNKKKKSKKDKQLKGTMIAPDFHLFTISKKQNAKRCFFEKLHNDILLFDSSISEIMFLTKDIKEYCINHIEEIITLCLSQTNIEYEKDIYGSFATGMMIETSDVDIKIRVVNPLSKEEFEKVFNQLVLQFDQEKKYETITPISTASVPVIKLLFNPELFIDDNDKLLNDWKEFKESIQYKNFKFDLEEINSVKIDITFLIDFIDYNNKSNTREFNCLTKSVISANTNNKITSSVIYAKEKLAQFPHIKLLIRLMKRYFYIKKMNNSFNGGLSSFNLFLVILSYVQHQKYKNKLPLPSKINLGFFLHDFLEFFSSMINFRNYIIDVNSLKQYIPLNSINSSDYPQNSVIILDPLTGANASKSSYRIDDIQSTFYQGYIQLNELKNDYENYNMNLDNNCVYSFLGV